MSVTRSTVSSYDLCNIHDDHTCYRSFSSVGIRPQRLSVILAAKHGQSFADHGLFSLKMKHKKRFTKMEIHLGNEIHELASSSGNNNLPDWANWIWGALLTLLLPFAKSKGNPLQFLKKELDIAVETAETMTEMVEDVAEKIEEIADEVADKLPDDMKLKAAIRTVENLAEEAVKDAKKVEAVIHQVEEAEKKVEDMLKASGQNEENVIKKKSD